MTEVNVYVTAAQLRDRLGDSGERLDGSLLERACNASSRAVDRHCGRRFWRDAVVSARVYRVDDPETAWVDDFSTLTGLVVKTDDTDGGTFGTTWASTDYQAEPLNADVVAAGSTGEAFAFWRLVAVDSRVWPFSRRRPVLQLTARYGWSAVPDDVAEATALLAVRLFRRKDVPFGIASFGEAGAVRIGRQDGDAAGLLEPFRRTRPRTLTTRPQRASLFHGWAS